MPNSLLHTGLSTKPLTESDHFLKPSKKDLKKILNEHSIWVLSLGKSGKKADVKNWKLDKTNLKMANLPFAKLPFVSLRGANLAGINFRQADLLKGSLIDADLEGADLEAANLSEGDLGFSKCVGANFADANLEGANFEGANLQETNFTRAILRGANFKEANLSSSEMIDANLEDANFEGAKLSGANFGGANLDKANFEKTDLRGLNIADTNLSEADDEGTKLTDSIRKKQKSQKIEIKKQTVDKATPNNRPAVKLVKEEIFVNLYRHVAVIIKRGKVAKRSSSYIKIQHKLIRHDCGDHPMEKARKIECNSQTQSEPGLISRWIVVSMHERVLFVSNVF